MGDFMNFNTVNASVLILLVLISINATIVSMESYGDYRSLKELKGKIFELYKVKRITMLNSKPGIIQYDELTDWLSHVLYLVTSEPSKILKQLQLKGYSTLNEEKIYIYEYRNNTMDFTVALGDLGHFYIKINNGEANEYQSCNISFKDYLENIRSVIRGRLPDKPGILKILWKGQYGEKTGFMVIGRVCNITNTTTTCYIPTSRTVEKVLYNPYEVYYIYLKGYRIEPPIKVRCCNPKYNYGFSAVYAEGFIPTLGREVIRVRIDDKYLNEILSQIKEVGVNIDDPDKLVVEDIYLSLGRNETLIPFIVLRYQNMRFWIAIEDKHPLLASYGSFISSNSISEYHGEVKIDWNNVLAHVKPLNNPTSNNTMMELSIALVIVVIMISIILVLKRRSK